MSLVHPLRYLDAICTVAGRGSAGYAGKTISSAAQFEVGLTSLFKIFISFTIHIERCKSIATIYLDMLSMFCIMKVWKQQNIQSLKFENEP